MCRFICIAVGLTLLASALVAQGPPRPGKIKKVDADKNTITISSDGKEQTFAVTEETRVMGAGFKPLSGRLRMPPDTIRVEGPNTESKSWNQTSRAYGE